MLCGCQNELISGEMGIRLIQVIALSGSVGRSPWTAPDALVRPPAGRPGGRQRARAPAPHRATFQALAPSEDMKRGIFPSPVCVEYTGNTCLATATEIANINPVAAAYIKDVWPKIPGGEAGTYNLFTPQRSLYNHRQDLIKIDHTFNARHSVRVRYLHDTIPTQEPGGLFTGGVLPGASKGWQLSGITSIASGLPLRVTSGLGVDWGSSGPVRLHCGRTWLPDFARGHEVASVDRGFQFAEPQELCRSIDAAREHELRADHVDARSTKDSVRREGDVLTEAC
jgi:hypothetical protein